MPTTGDKEDSNIMQSTVKGSTMRDLSLQNSGENIREHTSNEQNSNMQSTVKGSSTRDLNLRNSGENIREHTSNEQISNNFPKSLRLSAFLKELREAENEPIPDIKCSNKADDCDEINNIEDEELLELDNVRNAETSDTQIKSEIPNIKIKLQNNTASVHKHLEEFQNLNISDKSNTDLAVKWLYTPSKHLYLNNFLTPNIMNLNNSNSRSFSTQVKDKNSFKMQCTKTNNMKLQTSLSTIPFLNRESTKKKSLFSCQNEIYDKNVIDENKENIEVKEKMENKRNSGEDFQKILCGVAIEKPILDSFEKIIVNETEYIILNQIGRGGSSIVFHCYDPIEKCERAIKRVNLTGERSYVDGYINEVKMLHKLQQCDRIIIMYAYEIVDNEKVLFMVLEKGERDLAKILKELSNKVKHLPMYMLIYYWMEMLYAVQQIHENGIIHSDLKPANFLVVSSKLKLIDFGIASSLQNDMTSVVKNVQIGTFNYISPEALSNDSRGSETAKFKISFKSDVWSLGCILYQLVYRKTPFQHIGHTYAKLSAIVDPHHVIEYPKDVRVPQNIVKTIKSCLQYDMKSRPSVDELIKYFENMYY